MNLHFDQLPLETLFLDFNSFFASVEQQENPSLRGKPMIVAPVIADTTFAIAASYEAKKLGITTGTRVREALQICPELLIAPARPRLYKAYHEAIREVAQFVLPEEKVHSIDEMSYRLIGSERRPEEAIQLAQKMKSIIQKRIGECLTCSIGISSNTFLAKIATEIEKPNGLVVLESQNLPGKLLNLKLTDLTGINIRMASRLNAAGIFSVKGLYEASKHELGLAFGSIIGERWWYLLRGYPLIQEESRRKSIGHSNVLAPKLRNEQGCYEVLLRLLQKAGSRLRSEKFLAGYLEVKVSSFDRGWQAEIAIEPTNDTVQLNAHFREIWKSSRFNRPRKVSVTLGRLSLANEVTPSLFETSVGREPFNSAVDELNKRFGKNKIYLAGMHHAKDTASEKIAFNKTWLLSEGKNDNDWERKFHSIIKGEH